MPCTTELCMLLHFSTGTFFLSLLLKSPEPPQEHNRNIFLVYFELKWSSYYWWTQNETEIKNTKALPKDATVLVTHLLSGMKHQQWTNTYFHDCIIRHAMAGVPKVPSKGELSTAVVNGDIYYTPNRALWRFNHIFACFFHCQLAGGSFYSLQSI